MAFVRSRIGRGLEPEQICEELLSHCLASDFMVTGVGCDNMTVVLVCLTPGGAYTALAERCARPPLADAEDSLPTGAEDEGEDEGEGEEEDTERGVDGAEPRASDVVEPGESSL